MTESTQADDLFYVFGVNASTGSLIDEPLKAADIAAKVQQQAAGPPDKVETSLHNDRDSRFSDPTFRPSLGVDERVLSQAGWGVVLAAGADPKILQALSPLLAHRRQQAGPLYKEYTEANGYLPNDTWDRFRVRGDRLVSTGLARPQEMPYYVLLVGSPEDISLRFQYHMDVERAVGRLHFDTLDQYRQYAESVVQAESGKVTLPRKLSFLGTANPDDRATQLSSTDLVQPLFDQLSTDSQLAGWSTHLTGPDQASKEALGRLLGGADAPALLFTASHGAGFDQDDPRQAAHTGALVTKEYPGPLSWRKPLKEDFYFHAQDLDPNAHLWGMIAVFFACFGAGIPPLSDFYHLRDKLPGEVLNLAPRPFFSALPRQMLCHPNGGALAVVGHVERNFAAAFRTPGVTGNQGRDLLAFQQMLSLLARGYPVGAALEDMNTRSASRSVALTNALFPVLHQGLVAPPELEREISNLWTSSQDARNYIILGDPAVTLPLAEPGAEAPERTSIGEINSAELQSTPAGEPAKETPMPSAKNPGAGDPTDVAFLPPIDAAAIEAMTKDPKIYEYWREHIHSGFLRNDEMFKRILNAFLGPYYATVWMYGTLFAVGVLSFIAAVVLSLVTREAVFALAFGGLSVVSFLSFFIRMPLRSLEENLEFITWLGFIYNTYWNRVVYAMNQQTVQDDLQKATSDAVKDLQELIKAHAAMSGKRVNLS